MTAASGTIDVFQLNCLVLEYPIKRVFAVKIEVNEAVSALQNTIKETLKNIFVHVDAPFIDLLRVSIPIDDHFSETDIELKDFVDERVLPSWKTLRSIFTDRPAEGHVHIIVKPPPQNRREKLTHRPSEEEGPLDRLKRTKLATNTPSITGEPSIYKAIQTTYEERILDDRPQPDDDIPPISLLYDGFGLFLDILRGKKDIPLLIDIDIPRLRQEVDEFADQMCEFYEEEVHRRDTALPILDRIFSAQGGVKIPSIRPCEIGSVTSGGHNSAKCGGCLSFYGFRNEAAEVPAIPEVELLGYVVHQQCAVETGEMKRLFEGWRTPYLGLTVVGEYAHSFRVVGLSKLSCIRSFAEGGHREALYNAFAAASVLQARILQDMERHLLQLPPKIPDGAHRFPAISALHKFQGSSNEYVEFQIQMRYPDIEGRRWLYIATTSDPAFPKILIKFTRQYSLELHEFCASRDMAPRILGFQQLPGEWQAIAMQYISTGVPITLSTQLESCRERWTSELTNLVKCFHDQELVHGDLRDANIICDEKGRLYIVDYDWGGKEGHAFYPTPNLNRELLDGRMGGDLKISKHDDERILQRTLEKLKRS
ncbi:hypothetical protein H0H93_001214 [Arthromyces matolae]|nr:hypothetical protein H0H93_001214 [Arthromyces matolae]